MEIVINLSANISHEVISHYGGITVTPQQIVEGGRPHDTREITSLDLVDEWVRASPEHPQIIGTSAKEFIHSFVEIIKRDRDILVITTSRKVIQTFQAALAATRTLASMPACSDVRVRVVDSGGTDVLTGLLTILAAEGRKAGLSLDQVGDLLETAAQVSTFTFTVDTLTHLTKGGRAPTLKTWMAGILGIRPLLVFREGEVAIAGKVQHKKENAVVRLADLVGQGHEGAGPVWLGVSHGNDDGRGRRLVEALKSRFNAEFVYFRPFCSSVYLNVGPAAISAAVLPLAKLGPWRPPPPLNFRASDLSSAPPPVH